MKTLQEALTWNTAQEGKVLPWKGYSQCVAFARNYVNFLDYKQPAATTAAKDLWAQDWGPEFTKSATPCPGDIAILGPTPVNEYGHIDVVLEVRSGNVLTMDQNLINPMLGGTQGSPIAKVVWRYPNGRFLGFIRPKFKEEGMFTSAQIDEFISLAYNSVAGRPPKDAEFKFHREQFQKQGDTWVINMLKGFEANNDVAWKKSGEYVPVGELFIKKG